jgi:hypothetical protein
VGLAASCEAADPDPREMWEACLGGRHASGPIDLQPVGNGAIQDYSGLEHVAGYDDPECALVDDRLSGGHRLRLLGEARLDPRYLAEGLQRYYRRHGLQLSASVAPIEIELPYLLDNNRAGLDEALRCAFPGIQLGDENRRESYGPAVEAFAVNYILRPVRRFLEERKGGDRSTTDLVAVERTLRESDGRGAGPVGLAISVRYLAALRGSNLPEAEIWRGVHLPAEFNATVFMVGPEATTPRQPPSVARDLTVAHELGHTTGLLHSQMPGNLMVASVDPLAATCRVGLRPDQLATMASVLKDLTATAPSARSLVADDDSPAPTGARQALRRWLRGNASAFPDFAQAILHPGSSGN